MHLHHTSSIFEHSFQFNHNMPKSKAFNHSDILNKALELFWQKGFHSTSMEDLVNELGINRSSIYDTFGNKNELFHQLIEHYQEKRLARLRHVLFIHEEVIKGFRALFDLVIQEGMIGSESKGCLIINSITELALEDFALNKKLEDYICQTEKLFKEYLFYGQKTGQIAQDKDIEGIASFLYTLKSGIFAISKVRPQKERLLNIVNLGLVILE